MEATGIHSAVVVGHSMGSAIALSMALEHPDHVLGLGLIGAASRLRVAADLLENASNPTTLLNAVNLIVSRSFASSTQPAFVALAGQRFAETRSSVLYGDFLACDAFDVTDRLGEVRAPALVVTGAEDQMAPARYAGLLAGSLPNASLKIIPDAGHMVMLEKPREVAATLLEFLAGIAYY
jgi:pimeloyl-ACP methyl ester carboxylesterase